MAKYVSKKDYFDFSGIDLDLELNTSQSDNPTKAVEIFLTRVENWCLEYLASNYMVKEEDIDEEQFKKGLLHQVDYVLKHGYVSRNMATNIKVLSPDAFRAFKLGGMCNTALPRVSHTPRWL